MDFLTKPDDIELLIAQLEQYLEEYDQEMSAQKKRVLLEKMNALFVQINTSLNSPRSKCQLMYEMTLSALEIFDYQIAIRNRQK